MLFKLIRKEFGDYGNATIKLVRKEEDRIHKIIEDKIRRIILGKTQNKTLVKSKVGLKGFQPLKSHFYFKVSYLYLKKFASNLFLYSSL